MYLLIILAIIIGEYFINFFVEYLNLKNISSQLPDEFVGFYDQEKYKKSQDYLKVTTKFGLIKETIMTAIILFFILLGGFNSVDIFARSFDKGPILTGLIFAGVLMLFSQILSLPFSAYSTFVIEEKFGFNRTTIKTFILDFLKMLLISAVIGAVVFSVVIWFFKTTKEMAWAYCWIAVTVLQMFLVFIAPVVIMPLFNKFIPLEEGKLKTEIENYAKSQKFALSGLFKIDASRRSSKSNAFFTGFGKYRRIALFDTLIEKHTVEELVSVLAHEIGHYKKKHILKTILLSTVTTGLMFFILSLFINNQGLFAAFRMENLSVYASLIFFAFLYSPISLVLSVFGNVLSRKHEFEADRFAVETYHNKQSFIDALKKLTVDNLSNLTPHPLKVFLYYSHPPVLERINALS